MRFLFYFYMIFFIMQSMVFAKIKVACIGNSITFGYGVVEREKLSYPGYLSYLLGDNYEVGNFGVSGATLLRHGDNPYYKTKTFDKVFEFQPDIVFIMLGTNDSKVNNSNYLNEFVEDYNFLIDTLEKGIPNLKKIVLLSPIVAFTEDGIRNSVIKEKIIPRIEEVGFKKNLPVLDLYHLLIDKERLIPDKIHPSSITQRFIAWRIAEFLLSKFEDNFNLSNEKYGKFYSYRNYIYKNFSVSVPKQILKGRYWILNTGNDNELNRDIIKKVLLDYGVIIINADSLNNDIKLFKTENQLSDKFLEFKSDGFSNGYDKLINIDTIDFEKISVYPYVYEILRFFDAKINFAVIPSPGVEYRTTVGWAEGSNWFTIFDSFNNDLTKMEKLDVLFLGNSITQGIGISSKEIIYRPGSDAFKEIFKDYKIYAAGISSDHVENLLYRIVNGKYPKHNPEYVIITIGVNNFPHNSADEITDGIKLCVKETLKKFPDSKIILFGPFIAGYLPGDKWRIKYRKIQNNLKNYKFGNRVYFFDLEKEFILQNGNLNLELFRPDRLHINSNGYRVWAEKIRDVINIVK